MWFSIEAKRCIFYILSLIFLCATSSGYPDPALICPPSELIAPCICFKGCAECTMVISCVETTDQEVLSRVFTSEYPFEAFILSHSSVMFIPDSLFEVRRLTRLTIEKSSVVSLFNSTPTAENSINYIWLEKVQILRGFQWEMLSGFKHLETLFIIRMHVPRIDQSFVDHAPKSLRAVIVNRVKAKIHDEAFAALHKLVEVIVTSGKIKELKRSMFPTPSILKTFDFRGNRLSSLPHDIFSEMPDLELIDLSENLLKEMPENTFGPVFSNLYHFDIHDNPLVCRCNIRWITIVKKKLSSWNFHGTCKEPQNLQGRYLSDLVPGDFFHCG